MVNIAVIGAGGRAGRASVDEALRRGHRVTAVVRNPGAYRAPAGVSLATADVTEPAAIAAAVAGCQVVVASVYDRGTDPAIFYPAAGAALQDGLTQAAVRRLVWVGLASLLRNADGVVLAETPGYPPYPEFYRAHADALSTLQGSGFECVAISPSGDFDHDGTPVGGYREAPGDPSARITYADYAIAVVDRVVGDSLPSHQVGVVAAPPGPGTR
jgi:putative NADH-flavin reductase